MSKRLYGQYFTRRNIFDHDAFYLWANEAALQDSNILEPFAGANHLIEMLQQLDLCRNFSSFDISPQSPDVIQKDTLLDFPQGYHVVITNPPYLAKNSAMRRKIPYTGHPYDDLYKYALAQCLSHTPYVGAIIPASFLNARLFRDRLHTYIALPYEDMFLDTKHPVCLALFSPQPTQTLIYEKDLFLGILSELEAFIPQPIPKKPTQKKKIIFNHPQGNIALIAIDGTIEPSISFIEGLAVDSEKIKDSSRNITKILITDNIDIPYLNHIFEEFRRKTNDIFLTPFKGIRQDGRFRRRLDYRLARKLLLSL
ncbi:MAG: Eco57I restriction-modification methylase domain-containing protein [Brevinema sp.]